MPDIIAWAVRPKQAVGFLPRGMRASLIHLMPEEHGQNGLCANSKEAAWSCHMDAKANESPERAWAEQLPCAISLDGRERNPDERQTSAGYA